MSVFDEDQGNIYEEPRATALEAHEDPAAAASGDPAAKKPAKTRPAEVEVGLDEMMRYTQQLQTREDLSEAVRERQFLDEEARLQEVRNARWEAVKKRMRANAVDVASLRRSQWESASDDDGAAAEESGLGPHALEGDAISLVAARKSRMADSGDDENGDGAVAARGGSAEQETVVYEALSPVQQLWHFIYNWGRFFVFALSMSPYTSMYEAEKGYYTRRKFTKRS